MKNGSKIGGAILSSERYQANDGFPVTLIASFYMSSRSFKTVEPEGSNNYCYGMLTTTPFYFSDIVKNVQILAELIKASEMKLISIGSITIEKPRY